MHLELQLQWSPMINTPLLGKIDDDCSILASRLKYLPCFDARSQPAWPPQKLDAISLSQRLWGQNQNPNITLIVLNFSCECVCYIMLP